MATPLLIGGAQVPSRDPATIEAVDPSDDAMLGAVPAGCLLDVDAAVTAAVKAAGIAAIEQYAELGPLHRGRILQGSWGATDLMIHEPRGVAVVLTPWNDPDRRPADRRQPRRREPGRVQAVRADPAVRRPAR